MPKVCRWSGLLIAFLFGIRADGAELRVTSIETLSDGRLRLRFEDTGLGLLNHVPSVRFSLTAGSTNRLDPSRRITELTPGVFETIIPDPGGPAAFFQIAGFSAPDVDADGLSDALETLIGTSTNTFDTDGDGFGDANEIVNGSDPVVASSVPNIIKVNFASPQSSVKEGDGTHLVPVSLSRNFTGRIRYSVAAMSTAVAATDFGPLAGFVDVSGTIATIPVTLIDDLSTEDVKMLVIDLENDTDFAYQTGGATRHFILLHDNDTSWSGVLRNEVTEQGFRLRMLRQGTAVQAALVSSMDTNSPAGVQGVGSIPAGTWPMTTAALTTNTFEAVSGPIPMGTSTLFGESALNRVLSFNARPGADGKNPGTNYLFKPNMIIGTFTDRIAPVRPDLPYLGRETSGLFVLIEDLPTLPFPDLPSVPPPPAPPLAALQTREVQR